MSDSGENDFNRGSSQLLLIGVLDYFGSLYMYTLPAQTSLLTCGGGIAASLFQHFPSLFCFQ